MKFGLQGRALCALAVLLVLGASVRAQAQSSKRLKDAARHSSAAARVFNEIMNTPDKGVPKELLDKAEAVAVFPGVVKAAFIIGGRGGQGVISRRIKGGWSAPAFFNIGGGSFGLQIGAQKTDYVLLIMNEAGIKGLMEDKFEIGGAASVAAGPVGRTAAASTNVTLDAGILTYSRSKGLFAGVSLEGAVIDPDNDLNEAMYEGKKAREVLEREHSMREMPAVVRIFPRTLARYSVRR
ncbi:MAG: lipid-binding SYLF domain-containing protein [Pyrinomonadaceae bacterium]|nr:lipid-binding SYLF domain-containing protein [Pyrinomonadaceae bacterium]